MIVTTNAEPLLSAPRIAFGRALEEIVGLMRADAPVSVSRGVKLNAGDVQGGLRASLTHTPIVSTGAGITADVGSPVRYAAQREFGGTIRPVRKRLLAWQDPATGKWIFARSVTQLPGGARNGHKPFIRPNAEKFREIFPEHLRAVSW